MDSVNYVSFERIKVDQTSLKWLNSNLLFFDLNYSRQESQRVKIKKTISKLMHMEFAPDKTQNELFLKILRWVTFKPGRNKQAQFFYYWLLIKVSYCIFD